MRRPSAGGIAVPIGDHFQFTSVDLGMSHGTGRPGAVTHTGLGFLSSTEPLDGLSSAFSLGSNGFDVNQVRVGF